MKEVEEKPFEPQLSTSSICSAETLFIVLLKDCKKFDFGSKLKQKFGTSRHLQIFNIIKKFKQKKMLEDKQQNRQLLQKYR